MGIKPWPVWHLLRAVLAEGRSVVHAHDARLGEVVEASRPTSLSTAHRAEHDQANEDDHDEEEAATAPTEALAHRLTEAPAR